MDYDKSIKGKKILFFAPSFFCYESKIKSKMIEMGAIVDFYDVRSVTSALERSLLKISPKIFTFKTNKYYGGILKENKEKDYDFVFIVKCDMISCQILDKIKDMYKNAVFCLYLWDSMKNIPGVQTKLKYFDRVLSFDRIDTDKHKNIIFRPLFFLDDYRAKEEPFAKREYKYDLSFLGTIHSDRFAIIMKVKKICNNSGLNFFCFQYLQSKFIYFYYKILNNEYKNTSKNDFFYEKLNSSQIKKVIERSNVILDIQHPKQTGLTMRTIEMIGMNKKLVTTNEDIKNYDFYDPQNILVIDRNNINLPPTFFQNEYKPIEKKIYEKYYIENWIKDILL